MSFYRPLSPVEATFVATDTKEYTPFVNQFFAEGVGELNLEDWERAVAIAAKANPGMNLVLKGFWGWRHWDDEGPTPSVKKVHTDWDGRSSENSVCINSPINPYIGPTVEVILIESSIAPPKILIRSHHGVTDAKGMSHWLEECFRVLRGETPKGSPGKTSEWDIAKLHERPPYSIKTGGCIPITPKSTNPSERYCRWTTVVWEGKYTKVVPKLILSASNLARSLYGDEGKVIFRIPSDLRRYLGKEAPFSTANSVGTIDLDIGTEVTANSIQSKIIKTMRQKGDLAVFPRTAPLGKWLPKFLFNVTDKSLYKAHSSALYRMTGIISYLGDIDYSLFQYAKFKAKVGYGIPIPLENRSLFLGASLAPEGLMITVSIPKALATQDELLGICDSLKSEMDKL